MKIIAPFGILLLVISAAYPARLQGAPSPSGTKLRAEISFCNLLNGLYLSESQLLQLQALAEKVDRYRQALQQEEEQLHKEMEDSFSELRAVVLAGEPIPLEVKKRAVAVNDHLKEKVESFKKKAGEEAVRAEKIFSASQKKIINDFKPCLIPPHNLSNPERAGQADSSEHFEKILTRLRQEPGWRFELAFNRFFQRYREKIESKLGPLEESAQLQEKDRLYQLALRARAMSEVDFGLERAELARCAAEEGLLKDTPELSSPALRKKIAKLFFSPGSNEIYAQRLQSKRVSSP